MAIARDDVRLASKRHAEMCHFDAVSPKKSQRLMEEIASSALQQGRNESLAPQRNWSLRDLLGKVDAETIFL